MQVRLMYEDHDLPEQNQAPFPEDLSRDLELEEIFKTMARGDAQILESVKLGILDPLQDRQAILRRQEILKDCLNNTAAVRQLYTLTGEVWEQKQNEDWWLFSNNPSNRFYGSVRLLKLFCPCLGKLRQLAREGLESFSSQGFQRLFREICREITDPFLKEARALLEELEMKDGVLMSLSLGEENRPVDYCLVRKNPRKFHIRWAFAPAVTLGARDDAGARDLESRKDRACAESVEVLCAAAQAIEDYFKLLRRELAFYLGAENLVREMEKRRIPSCFPELCQDRRSFRDLRDLSLGLRIPDCVGNTLDQEKIRLTVVTGANQGGKTTFLRSLGQMQLLAQSGLQVAAERCCCPVCRGIYTHFNREEDESRGKLDEELQRLSGIVPLLKEDSLLLFNESFSSTNEREGSEICRQITQALLEHRVEQVHVSHLYSFTRGLYDRQPEGVCFLKAGRREDGSRSFRLEPGAPEKTAYGLDLYEKLMKT